MQVGDLVEVLIQSCLPLRFKVIAVKAKGK